MKLKTSTIKVCDYQDLDDLINEYIVNIHGVKYNYQQQDFLPNDSMSYAEVEKYELTPKNLEELRLMRDEWGGPGRKNHGQEQFGRDCPASISTILCYLCHQGALEPQTLHIRISW